MPCLTAVGLLGFLGAFSISAPPASGQTVAEFSAGISTGAAPIGIAAGADGNLWFTEPAIDRVGRITPAGGVTEFSAGITAGAGPTGITAGPDGNIWFTEPGIDSIGRITPAGVVTEFSAGITAGAQLTEITTGPDGNLWFTESGNDLIGRITTAGAVTEFGGLAATAIPSGISVGPDGNLWFAETFTDGIGRITTAGALTEFNVGITAGASPLDTVAGADGNVWFTEPALDRIGRVTSGGTVTEYGAGISAGAQPTGITAGPDGSLWFTELGLDRIGRITTAGAVTELSTGISSSAGVYGITTGPDGNIWFTESAGDRIGRVALVPAAPVQGKTATVALVSGTVLLQLPGASSFVELGAPRSIPMGTVVDTRAGVVELTSAADGSGRTQTARFRFGLFKLSQSARAGAYTELRLTGSLAGCGSKKKSTRARSAGQAPGAQAAGARGRRLWGSGSGKFRTSGRRGSGAARGTIWQVNDRCDRTTKIRSIRGKVTARDFVRKRTVILKTGRGYVAPGPRGRRG